MVAQTVQASLGLLPRHALAVGVRVAETDVQLCFRLTELTRDDLDDIEDIASELEALARIFHGSPAGRGLRAAGRVGY